MLSTDLLAFYRQATQQLLTVVDVETTGMGPPAARVTEVSVLQATLQGGIQQQQTHLINSQTKVPAQITRFTGITQAMVDQARPSSEVWPECLPWLSTGILTAHNLAFDYRFIQAEYDFLGINFTRPVNQQFCTVILARLMLPDLPSRSLPDLVRHFDFKVGRSHRAEADAKACWLLAERLLTEIHNETDQAILGRFARQWLPLGDAASILGCTGRQARSRLAQAGIEPRLVGRYKTPLYQRGAVERLHWDRNDRGNTIQLL